MRDYLDWHADYDAPGSRLHLRLLVVQDLVARALDELPAGPVRVISMCAGQGRDLLTAGRRHRRCGDLEGTLVELDPRNASIARDGIERAGLGGLHVVEADAGRSDAYADAVPADLVLACGVFGNITDDDIAATVSWLPALCSPGAWVVWTRYPRDDVVSRIETRFTRAGFSPQALVVSDANQFAVGACRLDGAPTPFAAGVRLFDFVR